MISYRSTSICSYLFLQNIQVDLGSLQDTVPTDRIVVLGGGWGLFRNRSSGEILVRLTYKAYVEDEEDDKAALDALDTDISDDESSDSDEPDEPNGAYDEGENDAAKETDKESFMDVLAALIVSEEFQGIVASDTLNTKLQNDATTSSSIGTTRSRSRDVVTDNKPAVSGVGDRGLAGNIVV